MTSTKTHKMSYNTFDIEKHPDNKMFYPGNTALTENYNIIDGNLLREGQYAKFLLSTNKETYCFQTFCDSEMTYNRKCFCYYNKLNNTLQKLCYYDIVSDNEGHSAIVDLENKYIWLRIKDTGLYFTKNAVYGYDSRAKTFTEKHNVFRCDWVDGTLKVTLNNLHDISNSVGFLSQEKYTRVTPLDSMEKTLERIVGHNIYQHFKFSNGISCLINNLGSTLTKLKLLLVPRGIIFDNDNTEVEPKELTTTNDVKTADQPVNNLTTVNDVKTADQPVNNLTTTNDVKAVDQPVNNLTTTNDVKTADQPVNNLTTTNDVKTADQPVNHSSNADDYVFLNDSISIQSQLAKLIELLKSRGIYDNNDK